MDAKALKKYIHDNNRIGYVLESIRCHHVKYHSAGYWTCANPDGDNKQAISVYCNDNLNCINYTRDMTNGKNVPTDIITLVCYIKKLSFPKGLQYICNELGIDYYYDFDKDIPESLKITNLIFEMNNNGNINYENEKQLKPISEKILSYYKPYVNDMFLKDGISYETQQEFEIGYDDYSDRITIPIRDEINSLIGVKGRIFKNAEQLEEWEQKYIYLEPCARSKILYGLNKTHPFIKQAGKCLIGESEKFVMQLWDMEYCYSVGIGGTKITKHQIEKLTRLGIDLIFCFDKGIKKEEIEKIADLFVEGVSIYYLYDKDNILKDKESPSDSKRKFEYLYENCLYKVK